MFPEPLKIVKEDLEESERFSRKLLDSKVEFVLRAGNYILDSGGKRIRPALTIITGKMFGAEDRRLIPVATVMEYMHTATLLHDDIVDGAKLRRGKPSANVVFGNDIAVLVGDYLFAKAIYVLAVYGGEEVLKVSAETVQEMAEGEILQLEKIGDVNITEDEYFEIIRRKTASLLSTCCSAGATLGSAGEREREIVKRYGEYIGYAFQLVDDLLDYVSSEKTLGKPAGNDIREGKVTYPLISALKGAKEKDIEKVKEVLSNPSPSRGEVEMVRNFVLERKGDEKTLELAKEYSVRAKELLSSLPPSPFKKALRDLADFIVERSF